jgi:hypothetical protein
LQRQKAGHLDVKGLKLTEALLTKVVDFGTIWNWRREGLELMLEKADVAAKQSLCEAEIAFNTECLKKNPKS